MFYTRWEYRIWITASILIGSLIGKDFTFLISSFWMGWTVSKVQDHRTDIVVEQLIVILVATIAGTLIGHNYSLLLFFEGKGWI